MNRKILVAVAITLCVVAAIYVFRSDFDFALFWASLKEINPWWMTASIAVSLVTYIFRAYRWRILLRPVKVVPIPPLFEATLVGFSTIFVLGRAGEVARPVWLMRRENVPFSASLATLVAERCLDMISLGAFLVWALLTLDISTESAALMTMKTSAWGVLAIFIAGLVALIAFGRRPDVVLRWIPFARIRALAAGFADGLVSLNSVSSLVASLVHSAIIWLGIVLQFWFLLLSMGFDFSAAASTLVLAVTAIGSLLQIPGIGGGFQFAFMGSLQTFFSVSKERAIAAALVAWVSSYVPTIVCTAIYLPLAGVRFGDLRSALRKEQAAAARK